MPVIAYFLGRVKGVDILIFELVESIKISLQALGAVTITITHTR